MFVTGAAGGLSLLPLEKLAIFPKTIVRFSIKEGGSGTTISATVGKSELVLLFCRASVAIRRPRGGSVTGIKALTRVGRALVLPSKGVEVLIRNVSEMDLGHCCSNRKVEATDFRRLCSVPYRSRLCRGNLVGRVRGLLRRCLSICREMAPRTTVALNRVRSKNLLTSVATSSFPVHPRRGRRVLRRLSMTGQLRGLVAVVRRRVHILRVRHKITGGLRHTVSRGRHRCILHRRVGILRDRLSRVSDNTNS